MNPIPSELQYLILAQVPQKGAYNRIESMDLFVRIAMVCKGFRHWVLCSENGPLKFPEKEVQQYISSPYLIDLRPLFCKVNLERAAIPKQAFHRLEKSNFVSGDCHPLVTNHENKSLIDVAISKTRINFKLLEQFFSKLNSSELVGYFQEITRKHINDKEHYTQLLDLFFEEIKRKKGNSTLAKETMQPILGQIVDCLDCKPLMLKWISEKGMKYNIQNLADASLGWITNEKTFDFLKMVLDSQPDILDQTTSSGKRFIHLILEKQFRNFEKYYRYVLGKFPAEITAKDREGKSAISYFFKHSSEWMDRTIFNEKVLLEVREECFQTILSYMKQKRLDFFHYDLTKFEEFFEKLKDLFPDQLQFSKWLYSPYGAGQKLFLDELLDISLLQMGLGEFFGRIAPNNGNMHGTFALAKEIFHFEKENWAIIRENYSKYPNLKETLLLHLFSALVSYHYRTVEERMSKLTDFFGIEWVHQDTEGNTLLHHLCSLTPESWNVNIKPTLAFMMDHGFDPNLKNKKGQTARDLAKENGWRDYIHLIS